MAWHIISGSIGYIGVPNKGIEQACSWASCDIQTSPFSINLQLEVMSYSGPWPASHSRVGKIRIFPQYFLISRSFSHFSSNFLNFLPHFGLPGGRLAHPGRPWLRHWSYWCLHSPSTCTLAKATDQHHERVSCAACFGPSALKVRSFWMDYACIEFYSA